MPSRSLNSVSTALADEVLHVFIACFTWSTTTCGGTVDIWGALAPPSTHLWLISLFPRRNATHSRLSISAPTTLMFLNEGVPRGHSSPQGPQAWVVCPHEALCTSRWYITDSNCSMHNVLWSQWGLQNPTVVETSSNNLYFMHKGIQYYYLVDFRDLTILPHYYRRGGAEAWWVLWTTSCMQHVRPYIHW